MEVCLFDASGSHVAALIHQRTNQRRRHGAAPTQWDVVAPCEGQITLPPRSVFALVQT